MDGLWAKVELNFKDIYVHRDQMNYYLSIQSPSNINHFHRMVNTILFNKYREGLASKSSIV